MKSTALIGSHWLSSTVSCPASHRWLSRATCACAAPPPSLPSADSLPLGCCPGCPVKTPISALGNVHCRRNVEARVFTLLPIERCLSFASRKDRFETSFKLAPSISFRTYVAYTKRYSSKRTQKLRFSTLGSFSRGLRGGLRGSYALYVVNVLRTISRVYAALRRGVCHEQLHGTGTCPLRQREREKRYVCEIFLSILITSHKQSFNDRSNSTSKLRDSFDSLLCPLLSRYNI